IIEWAAYNPSGNNARPFWISKGNSAILNIPKSDDAYVGSKYNDILKELKSYTSEQSIDRICNDLTSYVRTHENSSIPGIGKVFNDTRAFSRAYDQTMRIYNDLKTNQRFRDENG